MLTRHCLPTAILLCCFFPCAAPAVPFHFEPNLGQWPTPARFRCQAGGMIAALDEDGIHIQFSRPCGAEGLEHFAVRLSFEGRSQAVEMRGESLLQGVKHYLRGRARERWVRGVPLYQRITYRGLYDGVDLQAREAVNGLLEYDLLLEPGADLSRCVVHVEGALGLHLTADGALEIATPFGPLRQSPPIAWQMLSDGQRRVAQVQLRIIDAERFGFEASHLDPDLVTVVDPVLEFMAAFGGSGREIAFAMERAPGGDLLLAGYTDSLDLVDTVGAIVIGEAAQRDAFALSLTADGTDLNYFTIIGGAAADEATSAALHASGGLAVAGYTASEDFPVSDDAFDGTANGDRDAFVMRLAPGGDDLEYGTFLGGQGEDGCPTQCLALDSGGAYVLSGWTASLDFPTSPGAIFETYRGGNYDTFVAVIDPSRADQLAYSTYLGGRGDEALPGQTEADTDARRFMGCLALTPEGLVHVACWSTSTDLNVAPPRGGADIYVATVRPDHRLSPSEQLQFATRIGGDQEDTPVAMTCDGDGSVLLTGWTWSGGFPVTPGAFRAPRRGLNETFVIRILPDPELPPAEQLAYSALVGGSEHDVPYAIGVDAQGLITVVGRTPSADFHTTPDAAQPTLASPGERDAFLFRLDPAADQGEQLIYSTLHGGAAADWFFDLALEPSGVVTVCGATESFDYPTTPGTLELERSGRTITAGRFRLIHPEARLTVTPESGDVGTEFLFDAGASSPGDTTTQIKSLAWDFGDSTQASGLIVTHSYAAPGRYRVTLEVKNDLELLRRTTKSIDVHAPPSDVAPWTVVDIGDVGIRGGARWQGDAGEECLAIAAAGKPFAGGDDAFCFAHQPVAGEVQLEASLEELHGSGLHAAAGLMLRAGLEPGAPYVAVLARNAAAPTWYAFWRESAGVASRSARLESAAKVRSARLERRGEEVIAAVLVEDASGGSSWLEHPVAMPDLPATCLLGCAATAGASHGAPSITAAQATFCQIELRRTDTASFLRGDCNGDGAVVGQVTDAVFLLAYSFTGGATPPCLAACDANADGKVDISDAIYTLAFNFLGGPPPAAPFPGCGPGEAAADKALGCAAGLACP